MRLIRSKDSVYRVDDRITRYPAGDARQLSADLSTPVEREDNSYVAWPDVHQYLDHIISQYDDVGITFITCPPGRGGLVPAAIAAYKLDIPFIAWESVTPFQQGGLCIDDIVDTGTTFKSCMNEKPWLRYCAMTSRWLDFGLVVGKVLMTAEYVIFPWDAK